MSATLRELYKDKKVWNRPTALKRRDLWERAGVIYGVWVVSGKGYKTIMKVLKLDGSTTIKNMLKMFSNGWNPSLDQDWVKEFCHGI